MQKLTVVREESNVERSIEGRKANKVQGWCHKQQLHRNGVFSDELAPDGWIDLYGEGRLQHTQWTNKGARPTIKAELEDFLLQSLHVDVHSGSLGLTCSDPYSTTPPEL